VLEGYELLHLFHGLENCKVPMRVESNPEVISIPMQQINRKMYMSRRLGFLYHLTLSSSAMRVRIGSEKPSVAPILG